MFVRQQFVVHLGRPIDPNGGGGTIGGIGWEIGNIIVKNQSYRHFLMALENPAPATISYTAAIGRLFAFSATHMIALRARIKNGYHAQHGTEHGDTAVA
jgi:hypothetical protein